MIHSTNRKHDPDSNSNLHGFTEPDKNEHFRNDDAIYNGEAKGQDRSAKNKKGKSSFPKRHWGNYSGL